MAIPENKRIFSGVCVLLVVNIIWVLSSELTNYIFTEQKYDKPFFTTYLKSSLFSFLLLGFLCRAHWRMLACPERYNKADFYVPTADNNNVQSLDILGEPIYVSINNDLSDDENGRKSDNDYVMINHKEIQSQKSRDDTKRSVKFCKYKEVRHLSETYAEDSLVARMSYTASKSLRRQMLMDKIIEDGFLPATHVMKLAVQFCFCWFVASYAYQKSLSSALPAVVNVISSTSSLFTLILATFFPSSENDGFSVTKLCVVFVSIGGVIMISFAEYLEPSNFNIEGIIWALISAIGYAIYLVLLRRKVKTMDQISLPMFLGFVGLWTVTTLWPGFFVLTWSSFEVFEMPNWTQVGYILVNGLLGTVGAELLWLWGCFLTSSLTATLAMCLTIPLTMVTDYFIKKKVYNWIFYLGSVPIIVSFIAIAYLSNGSGPSPDPVGNFLRRLLCCSCDKPKYERLTSTDPDLNSDPSEQTFPPGVSDIEPDHAINNQPMTMPFSRLFTSNYVSRIINQGQQNGDRTKLLINGQEGPSQEYFE